MEEIRNVTISDEGQKILDQPKIQEILKSIKDNYEYCPWVKSLAYGLFGSNNIEDALVDFEESKAIQVLEEEKTKKYIALSRFILSQDNSLFWTIQTSKSTYDTCKKPEVFRKIPTIIADVFLLSGITAEDIHRVSPKSIDHYKSFGFENRFDFANFIGACILAGQEEYIRFVEFDKEISDSIVQKIGIGASAHGDFRIRQTEQYTNGSIDPAGNKVAYAPYGPEVQLGAYHSVEPLILVALLKHVDKIGWSEDTQKQCIKKALMLYEKSNVTLDCIDGSTLFADFGENDGSPQAYEIEYYYKDGLAQLQTKQNDWVWDALFIGHHGGESLLLRTDGDNFVIQYGKRDKGVKWQLIEDQKIEIPPQLISSFLLALLQQTRAGLGRTSDLTLINILNARLKTIWH